MTEHPFGWYSFLPPLVAIALAILTRRIIASLLIGIFVGCLVLSHGDPRQALEQLCSQHLWAKLIDSNTLHIFFFTMLMGVMVGVINRGAGMKGLVNAVAPIAHTRRRGQLATWVLGLFIFFDDYANTMLLGNTLKPLTDRLKISREKLAYLVDSTAAPVSGLALVSTWVAGEIGYVTDGIQNIEGTVNWNPFSLFVASIPYRFYVLWALAFVPMIALLGRDFGPMLRAERDQLLEDDAIEIDQIATDPTAPDPETPARWINAVIPILVTVAAVVWFLYSSGVQSCTSATVFDRLDWSRPVGISADELPESLQVRVAEFDTDSDQLLDASEFAAWFSQGDDFSYTMSDIFGNADSYGSLLWGALAGAVAAFVLIWPQRIISSREMSMAAAAGALHMMPALGILWLASCLSTMTGNGPNAVDAAAASQAELMASVLSDAGQSPDQIASYLHERGVPVGLVAANILTEGLSLDQLQQRLAQAGFTEPEVDEVATSFTVHKGALTVPFPYRSYRLYSGIFLSSQLERLQQSSEFIADNFANLLPTMIFILSSIVAFATGTSWGTMGIVMPLVIPLAYAQLAAGGADVSASDPILLGSIGGVLAGAIFGDHCSPISDTTVLSSQASGCDHVAHVRTQLPYALLVAVVAVCCGTLPIGYGAPVWLMLPLGVAVMLGLLMIVGSKVEED